MIIYQRTLLLAAALGFIAFASAVELPNPGPSDPRIRYVPYKKDDIVLVNVRRGAVTRIVLAPDEQILEAGLGFPSDCEKPELEWCVVAEKGANQIMVKPKDNATHNNMEMKTSLRDYSFEFRVLSDAPVGRWIPKGDGKMDSAPLTDEPMLRVIFTYQKPPQLLPNGLFDEAKPVVSDQDIIKDLLTGKPEPRNWAYTSKVGAGAQDFVPKVVFDDGRFTCFEFPKNRQVPAIFFIDPTGQETRINHFMEGDLACVQRLGRQFVLRQGSAVIGIWNEAFDPDGTAVESGVTVDGVHRELRN